MSEMVERVEQAWRELRKNFNREHREGIISYRELKAGVNAAAFMRRAALGDDADTAMITQSLQENPDNG